MTELKTPLIVVNFKTYAEVEGPKVLDIASACQDVAAETGSCIVVCPPLVETARVAAAINIPVFSQHIDSKAAGANTGWITARGVKAAGAVGTLLNHSEHRMMMYDISASVKAGNEAGLKTIVCADNSETAQKVAAYEPSYIAIEPPELIGGDISVTDARPEVVREGVEAVRRIDAHIPVLCGAGVKTGKDVRKAIELGAKGVLLASGVVKAKDPRVVLRDLVARF
ncbi:MAG: Triosephosphate isomerase [Methanomassiliicoccales archaeon PtaU1.Bin124]|nr:MAG: Triosephosphate isomerase [Methanomassiliicoccales archaeon PtaU1.Bin124]